MNRACARARPLRADVGRTEGSIVRTGLLSDAMSFLAKPLTVASLTAKVREVLDAPSPVRDA